MGYTRRDCHIVGGNIIFGDTDIRAISLDERRALRGPKIAYIAQSAAASFNPAHTLMEQVCEASVRHGVLSRGGGARGSDQPVQAARSAEPGDDRLALSASGVRRPASARDGGDGDGRQARHSHLRRADHRARRDDAGRMPRRLPQAHPRAWHGGALHHPRPRRRRPDRRPDHGAETRQDGRIRRFAANPATAEGGIYAPPGERTRRRPQFRRRQRRRPGPDPRDRPRQRQLSRQAEGHRRRQPRSAQGRYGGGGRRVGLGQIDVWRAWSPASCRASPATCASTATSLPPRLKERTQGPAAPGADDLPDARRRAQSAAHLARNDRQAGGVLFQPLARGGARPRGRIAAADGSARSPSSRARPANCPAARSSACRSPGRWPPSPT